MRIGTSELILILVVALFVLGPEKMPVYARKVGKTLNSLKGYASKLSEDINENIVEPLEEIKKPLENATEPFTNISKTIYNPIEEMKKSINDIGKPKQKSTEDPLSDGRSSEVVRADAKEKPTEKSQNN